MRDTERNTAGLWPAWSQRATVGLEPKQKRPSVPSRQALQPEPKELPRNEMRGANSHHHLGRGAILSQSKRQTPAGVGERSELQDCP